MGKEKSNHKEKKERICALCGKKLRGFIRYETLGSEFCADCYGYVVLYCKRPQDVHRYSIDDLKKMHRKDTCDLCGKKVAQTNKKYVADGMICKECEKSLRPFYPIDDEEKKAALILNMISSGIAIATDTTGTMTTYDVDDPMELVTIHELMKVKK